MSDTHDEMCASRQGRACNCGASDSNADFLGACTAEYIKEFSKWKSRPEKDRFIEVLVLRVALADARRIERHMPRET